MFRSLQGFPGGDRVFQSCVTTGVPCRRNIILWFKQWKLSQHGSLYCDRVLGTQYRGCRDRFGLRSGFLGRDITFLVVTENRQD